MAFKSKTWMRLLNKKYGVFVTRATFVKGTHSVFRWIRSFMFGLEFFLAVKGFDSICAIVIKSK
jgi:hypothetical protein